MRRIQRVFSLAPDCHVSAGYYRVLWRRHFYDGIRDGVERLTLPEGVSFDWARWQGVQGLEEAAGAGRAANSEKIWDQIKAAHASCGLDAVISYCFARDVEPGLVRDTVRMGVPWVNFFCDSLHMFEQVRELASEVSLNWFPELAAMDRYQALCRPMLCRPFALNPEHLPELRRDVLDRAVTFIGFPSANRITRLGWFRIFGCKVDIRGRGWVGVAEDPFYSPKSLSERIAGALSSKGLGEKMWRRLMWPLVRGQAKGELGDEAFFDHLRGSLVILGLNQARDETGRMVSSMKFRDLEFPGYGCCYLTEHNLDVAAAFDCGKEVLVFRSSREGAALAREMIQYPERAWAIGAAGRRRVLSEHTWKHRLGEIAASL